MDNMATKKTSENRRDFLKQSSIAAGLYAAGMAPALNVMGANEKVQLGFIATGGPLDELMRRTVTWQTKLNELLTRADEVLSGLR